MDSRHWLWHWICCLFALHVTSNGQGITPTQNICHYDILPEEIISLLQVASVKVIKAPEPKDYSESFDEVKKKLLSLNETMFIVDEENAKRPVWDQLLKFQKRYGRMLSSILNANIDIQGELTKITETDNEISQYISSSIAESNKNSEILSNMTRLLDDIHTAVESSIVDLRHKMDDIEQVRKSREIEEETLILQKETHSLVKRLVDGSITEQSLHERISVLEEDLIRSQAEKNGLIKRLDNINTRPSDCHDIYISGVKTSGVYEIYPYSCYCSKPIRVWCDMKTEGGGWTVLLSRSNKADLINFTRSYDDYKAGFGDPLGEYWLGNELIHTLTSNRRYALRIDMQNRSGKKRFGQWDQFLVSSQIDDYELFVSEFSQLSTIGRDVLRKHNKQLFSTYDRDNDASFDKNCASKYKGGWWYGRCFDIHPTGILGAANKRTSVATAYFYYGRKSLIPLKKLSMKIKPRTCVSSMLEEQPISPMCKRSSN